MEKPINFQSIIMTLQRFWADQGCLIWQPYYTQVGAGTMNPATFLRVLGPEPWKAAYVEPSIRPDDGRYGENPYRFQQHYQFQVILKPDPGNPQELYLNSLQALGIDPHKHDIRFVEDNWESPALGAWGLGWEVWLDGQEITQFTYFQQAGGFVLDPVSVELTYGLERIAMPLQNHYHYRDLQWDEKYNFGDINFQGEYEHSKYYFEVAEVERLRQMYELYEKEAELALSQGLVLPAHDYILKCSHTFNIMDTRGAVGVTERQTLFGRMRDLAHRTAQAYLEQRKSLGYPWLEKERAQAGTVAAPKRATYQQVGNTRSEQTFLLEIGIEELPAGDLTIALQQLNESIPDFLKNLHLAYVNFRILGTPRRLVVLIEGLSSHQTDTVQIIKGPPVKGSLDAEGKPTKAAEGFAASKGLKVSDLKPKQIDGGEYLVAEIPQKGKSIFEILPDELPKLITSLHFDKSMRWNSSNVLFSRPIRWLLALFGDQLIDFEYAGLISSRSTRGLRFHDPEAYEVKNTQRYFDFLAGQGIALDTQQRKGEIKKQVETLMRKESSNLTLDENLVDEVNNLVEAPKALMGSFDYAYLELPSEVLISVMKKHQRCFPVQKTDGKLLPRFIAVRNGDGQFLDTVAHGNEQVIHARFADANFFISEDLKHKLEDFIPKLKSLIFHLKLGSLYEKSERIRSLVNKLAEKLSLSQEEQDTARRAAQLCKADLVSHMVIEMTSLQGSMGRYYALKSGEKPAVAQAIEEHYLPRFSRDINPASKAGLVVGLADRLDSLAGLFAVGLAPTSNKDPFALRRTAIGLVQNLIKWNLDFDLRQALDLAGDSLNKIAPLTNEMKTDCLSFIIGRLENYLLEQGHRYDVAAAVLAEQGHNPARAYQAIQELTLWVQRDDWSSILPAYARCVRITRDQETIYEVKPVYFNESAEKDLFSAFKQMKSQMNDSQDVNVFLNAFLPVIPTINQFFEKVMVMTEEKELRENRLGLLQQISSLTLGVADFSKLEDF